MKMALPGIRHCLAGWAWVLPLAAAAAASLPVQEKLQEVPFTQVKIEDGFWAPRRATNRLVSIPHSLQMLEKAGNIKNFELAAAGARTGYSGPVFMDSDLYKAMEAAAYSLATDPDPTLDKQLDGIIAKMAAAQMPDGYLNTHFQVNAPDQRWTNLRDWHELYCAGHMFEAAVAHYQATGKRNFLDIATRFANYIESVFGDGPGKRMGYPGHPEIELALIKLWRVTKDQRYFNLARFFVENRGRKFYATEHHTPLDKYDGTYWQDDVPIREHRQIKGHAVRAGYLLSGTVDVAGVTGDEGLLQMVDRVWRNTTQKRMYLTGGIGPSAHNEGFTEDYDLPNQTAYQETCASVAMALWNHRLNLLYGDGRYADLVERALYHGILAGVSLDGTRFFYVNPLSSSGHHHRSEWFGCACCPPNVARTLSALGNYVCAQSDTGIWINLYVQGRVNVKMKDQAAALKVTTDYPWDGHVLIQPELEKPAKFALRLRVPGWCQHTVVKVNRRVVTQPVLDRGYLVLDREWHTGDSVSLSLAMPVTRIQAHPSVKDDAGLLAIQRGPVVYCLEAADQTEPMAGLAIAPDAVFSPEKKTDLLGGVMVLKGTGLAPLSQEWRGRLYQPAQADRKVAITAIPYCVWDNRAAGPMRVWLPQVTPMASVKGLEAQATVTVSFKNSNAQPEGINDGVEPKSSGDQPASLCHWWPHKDSTEWVQFTWTAPQTVSGVKVYWFDDTGRGACRLPASWQILRQDGDAWKPVADGLQYPVQKDRWCEVSFPAVQTKALRLSVRLQKDWSAGAHEWKIVTPED